MGPMAGFADCVAAAEGLSAVHLSTVAAAATRSSQGGHPIHGMLLERPSIGTANSLTPSVAMASEESLTSFLLSFRDNVCDDNAKETSPPPSDMCVSGPPSAPFGDPTLKALKARAPSNTLLDIAGDTSCNRVTRRTDGDSEKVTLKNRESTCETKVCQLDVWNDVASKGQSHRYLVDNTSNASVPGLQLRRQVERNREVTYKSMVGPHRLQRGNLVYGDVIVPPLLLQGCGAHRHCRDILPKRLAT